MAPVGVVIKALSRIDPSASEMLIRSAVADAFTDAVSAFRETAEDELKEWQSTAIPLAKREFVRDYVGSISKGAYPSQEWVDQRLTFIEAVAKAQESWTVDGEIVQRDVKRDSKGRFSRSTSGAKASLSGFKPTKQDVKQRPEGRVVAPKDRLSEYTETSPEGYLQTRQDLSEEDKGRVESYMGAYLEAQKLQDELKQAFGPEAANQIRLVQQIEGMGDGQGRDRLEAVGLDDLPAQWDPKYERQTNLYFDAAPDADQATKDKVANANAAGGLFGATGVRAVNSEEQMQELLNQLKPGEGSPRERRYKQMGAVGNLLNQVAPGSSAARALTAGGKWGNDVEEALGPYAERAAYRFRGTEVRPDEGLNNQFDGLEQVDAAIESGGRTGLKGAVNPESDDVVDQTIARRAEQAGPESDDALKMGVRRDIAGQYLLEKIPTNKNVVELARRAGSSLPSQGVLIDADGDVVSESVGVGPDHYVPFDLKTMKNLNGGQYVRTRAMGGLTPEDVHAVLVGNGRAAAVVSPSGRFEIELDPDLRGKRRFNDKVMVMADRYERILDAVADSGMYVQDLPATEMEAIAERAAMRTGQSSGDAFNTAVEKETEKRRAELSRLTPADREEIERQVEEAFKDDKRGTTAKASAMNEMQQELLEEKRSQKVRQLKLNHEGYALALQTLQQQFPHAIRSVNATPLEEFAPKKGPESKNRMRSRKFTSDQGYVAPSGNRPRSEMDLKTERLGRGAQRWQHYESGRGSGSQQEQPSSAGGSSGGASGGTGRTPEPTGGERTSEGVTVPEESPLGAALADQRQTALPAASKALATWSGRLASPLQPSDTKWDAMQAGTAGNSVAEVASNSRDLGMFLLSRANDENAAGKIVQDLAANKNALRNLARGPNGEPSAVARQMHGFIVGTYQPGSPNSPDSLEYIAQKPGATDEDAQEAIQVGLDDLMSRAKASRSDQWAKEPENILASNPADPIAFPEVMGVSSAQQAKAIMGDRSIQSALQRAGLSNPSSEALSAAVDSVLDGSKNLNERRVQNMRTSGRDTLSDDERALIGTVTGRDATSAFGALMDGTFHDMLPDFVRSLQVARSASAAFEAFGGDAGPKVGEELGKRERWLPPDVSSRRLAGLRVLPPEDPRVQVVQKSLELGLLRGRRRR